MPHNETRAARATGTARRDQRLAKNSDTHSLTRVAPGASLRRRRAASTRLEPLASGARDPLDELADLPVRQVEYGGYDVITLGLACPHGPGCPAHRGRLGDERQGDEQREAA